MSIGAISLPFPGVRRVLEEGAKLGFWTFGAKFPDDVNAILLGAWSPNYDRVLAEANIPIGVLWTSAPGELALTDAEWGYLRHIIEEPKVRFIWFADESLAAITPKGIYAPYPVALPQPFPDVQEKGNYITLYQPANAKKNLFTQLLAAWHIQRDFGYQLKTNIPTRLIERLPFKLDVDATGWIQDRQEYERIMAGSQLNINLSFAETFSYQVAEAAIMGTPSLVGPAVHWFGGSKVYDVGSAREVLDVAEDILSNTDVALQDFVRDLIVYTRRQDRLPDILQAAFEGVPA